MTSSTGAVARRSASIIGISYEQTFEMSIRNLLNQANFSRQTWGQPGPASTPFSQSVVEEEQLLSRQTCGQPGPATPFSQSVVERGSSSPGKPAGNQALHRPPPPLPLCRAPPPPHPTL